LVLFFPETQRKLAGNGSRKVHGLLYRNLFTAVTSHKHHVEEDQGLPPKRQYHIPNPLACVPMLFQKGSGVVILLSSASYSVRMTLQASLAVQCVEIYNLNYLEAGLVYLPPGVAGAISAKVTGILIDRHYRNMCERLDGTFVRGENISDFPIEKARLRGAYAMLTVSAVGTVGYGLALMTKTVRLSDRRVAETTWPAR
jgi:hypothetical protein